MDAHDRQLLTTTIWHVTAAIIAVILAVNVPGGFFPLIPYLWFAVWTDRHNMRADIQLVRSRRLLRRHLKAMGA